ncbi:hypothetical protein MNBD_ALPHA07-741 [hydrothermal vent metagenome]|uniref:Uncharacterized protein n=1 Tax=hydrothermal vent metagenome TaxID=652676 RepID=A0A3B0SN30_9ZZZZ
MRFILPLALAFTATTATAQSPETSLARDGLEKTIAQLSQNPAENGFEIGMLQTLRAVEKTLQIRYQYGLGDSIAGMPLLRLDIGDMQNPAPKPSTPGTLSDLIDGFVKDMGTARTTLEQAETAGIAPFDLGLQDIWFDINSNGTRDAAESAFATLGPIILGRRAARDLTSSDAASQPLNIRFDEADHAWLLAYTHMLSGFGNLYLAFDPEPVLRDLADKRAALANAPEIPNIYDPDVINVEIARLKAEAAEIELQLAAIVAQITPLSDRRNAIYAELDDTSDEIQKAALADELDMLDSDLAPLEQKDREFWQSSRLIRNEINAAKAKLYTAPGQLQVMGAQFLPSIDLSYVVITALAQQPDPARIRAAHEDWRAMISQNRNFWKLLALETDNTREWIPNASQTSALPITIPPGLAEGWQSILNDIEAVLDGKLLITHPLLPEGYGISIPAYVADPAPLNIVNWIHGIGAYPYAARGPRLTDQSWQAFQRLATGNAGGFALLFN